MIPGLRPYQHAAVSGALEALREHRSALVVMPTGTGKTQVFVALASLARRGRVLMLAHRDELVEQAAGRVRQMLSVDVGIEKATRRANGEKIVVGSVQSLRGRRLQEWAPTSFSLVVVDEAHHAAARSYQAIAKHFAAAKILGVTATPDRSDGAALGRIFDTVAYEYQIEQAIDDGWLVAPRLHRVELDGLDLSGVSRRAGDLVAEQLEAQVLSDLERAAHQIVELAGERITLCYLPGVKSARILAQILDTIAPGSAREVDGETPTEERRELLRAHSVGEYQFLTNCMVLTEGYDSPAVSCLAMLRPTLSRALYAQMLGRGLRPAAEKTDCLVIDFNGCTGRHRLAGPEDVLGGSYTDEEIAEAREKPDAGGDVQAALRKSRESCRYRHERDEEAKAAKAAKRKRRLVPADRAADLLGLSLPGHASALAPTPKQAAALERFGVEAGGKLTRTGASMLMDELVSRARQGLATVAQLRLLGGRGKIDREWTRAKASERIDRMIKRRIG